VGITMSFNCCLSRVHCVNGIRSKGKGASKRMRHVSSSISLGVKN